MGATYTRQSSYSDGDVITAAHTNDEFNQLLAAFQASTGHTHDGTANEGGPITKLLGNSITLGAGTAGTDITLTFDGETSDGVMYWMEDEDHFKFADDVVIDSTKKLYFYDEGGEYIYASADGQLDLVAGTEIQIAATTIDINGAVDISGNTTIGGSLIIGGNTLSSAELAFLDGVTAGTVSASKALVVDSDKDIASLRNITLTGELDAGSLDVSGDADIDGTLEADAITVDGVALATYIRDTVGTNMLSSNTESGITVTYDTSNDNIDFAIDAAQTGITSLLATDIKIGEDDETKIDFETADEIHFFANNVSLISLTNANSGDAVLTVPTADKNFTIAGTDGSSGVTALDIDMALAGKATFSGDVVVTGDLTVTGDDIVMGTNTSGHIMVADGTNFNPVAVSGDVTIAPNGAVTIAGTSVETSMIAADAITEAKIADDAVESEHINDNVISGQTDLASGLEGTDELLVSDAGTIKKMDMTVVKAYMTSEGFVTDDPTALAIALG